MLSKWCARHGLRLNGLEHCPICGPAITSNHKLISSGAAQHTRQQWAAENFDVNTASEALLEERALVLLHIAAEKNSEQDRRSESIQDGHEEG